jgi:hypothetical protein
MTQEEFDLLPPQQKEAVLRQMEMANQMRSMNPKDNQPPPQQQGGGISPMQAYGAYTQFAPASAGGAAGGGSAAGGGAAGGAGSGAAGGGSAMAAAAPWAGLAAAIVGNELHGRKSGRRSKDKGEHLKEIGSGAVGLQDGEWLAGMLPGKLGEPGKKVSKMGAKALKKVAPWEWF